MKTRLLSPGLLVLPFLFASACATLSQDDCKRGDWAGLGRQDGVEGRSGDRFDKYVKACTEYGITPAKEAYEAGRLQGLTVYCAPANGLRMGKEGKTPENVCPPTLEPAFTTQYRIGKRIVEVQKELKKQYGEIQAKEDEMDMEKEEGRRRRMREALNEIRQRRDDLQRELTVLQVKGNDI